MFITIPPRRSATMTTRITPSFLLKGVDPIKMLKKYHDGATHHSVTKKNIKISKTSCVLSLSYEQNNSEGIFLLKDKNNTNLIIATSGHENINIYSKNGECPQIGGRCRACLEDFTHQSIGYPVAYQETTLLVTIPGKKKSVYRVIRTFWVEDIFCKFECGLYYIRKCLASTNTNSNYNMKDSERLLKMLHRAMHPKAGLLRPINDPLLLISKGGSLTDREWEDDNHYYVKTDRIFLMPAKTQYMRNNANDETLSAIQHMEDSAATTPK